MKLREDWKRLVKRAWSIRLNLIAIGLSGVEVGVNLLASKPPLPLGTFAALAAAVSMAAALARLMVQPKITPEDVQ